MKRIKVAQVVHGFGIGGLERVVADLVTKLDSEVFESLVVSFSAADEAARWIPDGDTEIVSLDKRKGNDRGLVRALAAALRMRRVDIVHSHNWGTLVETAWARRKVRVGAHVHSLHGTPLGSVNPGRIRGRLRALATRVVLGRCQAVVSVSESLQRQYADWCSLPPESFLVIPNGVDSVDPESTRTARQASRSRLGLPDSAVVIGSVGRLERVKGFDLALSTLAGLVNHGCDAYLVLVGNGSEEADLRHQAERLRITGRSRFVTGEIDSLPWLAALDIYLNSSRSEGMSRALLEAMAAGLPSVVTDVGDNARLVGGEQPCGVIVETEDHLAMSEGILTIEQDDRRSCFGTRARNRQRRYFDSETMVNAYASLYRGIMDGAVS